MKRYSIGMKWGNNHKTMNEDPQGEYVRFDDISLLEKQPAEQVPVTYPDEELGEVDGENYIENFKHDDAEFDGRLTRFFEEVYRCAHENGASDDTEPHSEDMIAHSQAIALQQYYQARLCAATLPYRELLTDIQKYNAISEISFTDKSYHLACAISEILHEGRYIRYEIDCPSFKHPSTAKEVPADDYAAHYERKWHAVSAECADLQDQLNAANTKIVQMELASRQSPADVLAVLDELEKGALRKHAPGCFSLTDDACCTCYVGKDNTKVRTLTAKLRSMLGGEV